MATLITPDGKRTIVTPKNSKHFSLAEMYSYIGCSLVQFSDGKNGEVIIFDEEGLCRGDIVEVFDVRGKKIDIRLENDNGPTKPYLNREATRMMHPDLGPFVYNVIVGNALVCSRNEVE